jgi:hypothetical protein
LGSQPQVVFPSETSAKGAKNGSTKEDDEHELGAIRGYDRNLDLHYVFLDVSTHLLI